MLKWRILGILESEWIDHVNNKPKLRLYKQVKSALETEPYVQMNLSRHERSFIAQCRFGILPLNLEIGRFRGIPLEQRTCPKCSEEVENEIHFLFVCPLYNDERQKYLSCVMNDNIVNADHISLFGNLCIQYPRQLAKYLVKSFEKRTNFVYQR